MVKKYDPPGLYPSAGKYYNAVETEPGEALVFSSGIVGSEMDGTIPRDVSRQIDLAWSNVRRFLDGCKLTTDNLVHLKMHLTDIRHLGPSKEARIRHLGEHMNCSVIGVIVGLFDPDLVIEIEVVAAR